MQGDICLKIALDSFKRSLIKLYQNCGNKDLNPHNHYFNASSSLISEKLFELSDLLADGEENEQKDTEPISEHSLTSIFDHINFGNQENKKTPKHFIPLHPLNLSLREDGRGMVFPSVDEHSTIKMDELSRLLNNIQNQLQIDPGSLDAYVENILSALQRFAWCIPAGKYGGWSDVSFYDHARMSAAISVCLSQLENINHDSIIQALQRYFKDEKAGEDAALLEQTAMLLVGGDISGIQDFIYTISSKNAAKTLRGRSLYLQLLTEAVLRYLLDQCNLPYSNVIFSGGGHFYFLAPLNCRETILQVQEYVTKKILEYHGVALYFALSSVSLPFYGLLKGEFPSFWEDLQIQLQKKKQNRYTELKTGLYDLVFKSKKHGGNQEKTCTVCGQESQDVTTLESQTPGDRICPMCLSFAKEFGKKLPHSKFIAISLGEPQPGRKQDALNALNNFGMSIAFYESEKTEIKTNIKGVGKVLIWALDDTKAWPTIEKTPYVNWLRYTLNFIPECSFDELQKTSKGIKRLGVLRMDVDNLGHIFSKGFGNEATLVRTAAISFQLSLFFEGWIKRLCQQVKGVKENPLIYAVYSGGDDLFLIGPWDCMPPLAKRIAIDLKAFAGENPYIHASAGISFIPGKYPVYQAAEDAGENLNRAKRNPGKNSISYLGLTCNWLQFDEVEKHFQFLVNLVTPQKEGGQGGPQALLQHLQHLAALQKDQSSKKEGQMIWGPWIWLGHYFLHRMLERAKKEKNTGLIHGLNELLMDLEPEQMKNAESVTKSNEKGGESEPPYKNIPYWGVAARWAQLLLREKIQE